MRLVTKQDLFMLSTLQLYDSNCKMSHNQCLPVICRYSSELVQSLGAMTGVTQTQVSPFYIVYNFYNLDII